MSMLLSTPMFCQSVDVATDSLYSEWGDFHELVLVSAGFTGSSFDYSLVSLVHNWFVDQALLLDCESTTDTVVKYTDSIYISRLQSLPYVMEMPYNSVVKSYIEMYAKRRVQVGKMTGMGAS